MRAITSLPLIIAMASCSPAATQPGDSGSELDAGVPDAGAPDAGAPDGGALDAGTADAGTDTWTSWATADFFQRYCTSCHTPGGQGDPSGSGLDFTQYADVAAKSALIRCGTAVTQDPSWGCGSFPPAKQFPIGTGPKPTDVERNRLVAWIDAGFPQ